MDLLFILILCVLATSKVTIQALFAKKNIKNISDGVVFNGLVFLFSALVYIKNALSCNLAIMAFSVVFGLLTVIFQLCYVKAMSCGNVSLTVLIVNLSMIIPVTVSIVAFGERLSGLRVLGIILTLGALVLNLDKENKSTDFKKWFLLSIVASLSTASISLSQQLFGKTQWAGLTRTFVACGYVVSALFSFLLYLVLKSKGKSITFKLKPNVFVLALCVGIILGVFQFLHTRAVAIIDSTIFFPTYNGGTLVLSTLSGVLLLKDKLKNNQKISVLIGIIAIILMNL